MNTSCELCKVIFCSNKDKESHLHGKKHLLAVHQANSTKIKQECGIFVTGFPNMVPHEELIAEFEKYGRVSNSFFGDSNRYCIVQFDSPEPVEKLVQQEAVWFRGKRVKVSRRTVREREAVKAIYESPMKNLDEINNNLKNIATFSAQLKWLVQQIQPRWEEIRHKICVLCQDLQWALGDQFPGCRIYTFGSTVTNLHFTNSDIDIYIDIPDRVKSNLSSPTPASLCVNKSKQILVKYGSMFSNVCAIPHAKTPIVKFVHIPTNLKCDFNFKNMLGVCNSDLIYYYLSLDHKLTPLMMLIKYWAKAHELTGLGGRFSNYSLALMFIFYMQQSMYSFPPVVVLQANALTNMQDGWNGGFQRIPTYSRALSTQTLIPVLQGFFEYYANFDYTLNLICPYLGKTIPKTDFVQPNKLATQLYLYNKNINEGKSPLKIDSPICIQDPFELNHNVSAGVNSDYLEEFTVLCKIATNVLKDPSTINEALYKILTEEPIIMDRRGVCNDSECQFKLLLSSTLLQINEIVTLRQVADSEKQTETVRIWQKELKVIVLQILKEIMRFNIDSEKEDKPDEKSQRRCGQKDIHDIMNNSFNCTGCYNLWDGHKTIMKDMNMEETLSLIGKQFAITKYIYEVLYKGSSLNEKIIDFDVNIKFTEAPAEAVFFLKNINSRPTYFKKFGVYFYKTLPSLFQTHLNEVIKNLKQTENAFGKEEKSS